MRNFIIDLKMEVKYMEKISLIVIGFAFGALLHLTSP